jgi:Fe-S cluster assembly protein SufD
MALNRQETESYLSAFKDYQKNGAGIGPAWLKELRESAIESFEKLGFPTSRDEDWKYTSVGPLVATAFQREERNASAAQSVAADAVRALAYTSSAGHRLVFVNGIYFPELSGLAGLPPGVRVESLASALRHNDDVLSTHLSRYVRYQEHSFVALNTAFIEDGAFVLIPKNTALEEPICLVFVSAGADRPVVSYPRNLIVAGEGSQARIVESHVGAASGAYLANAVTEISGGAGASIEHYLVQHGGDDSFHVGTLEARLSRQCNLSAYSISLAGSWIRNDVRVVLNGEGSECNLNGLYLVDGKQHVDNHTEIEHCKPRARSQELYKGI